MTPEQFPDKKRITKNYDKTVDLIQQIQQHKKERSVSQDEATWLPHGEYPHLPIAVTWMPDVHFGGLNVDYDSFTRDVNIIASTPNMYVLFGGDEIDNHNAIKYPSGIWGDGVPPQEQMEAWSELLTYLDSQSKVGAVIWGNHTEFSEGAGINPYESFFSNVDCPIFLDGGGVLNVVMEGAKYRVGMRHTHWGNSKLNMTNAAKRMLQFGYPDLDIALTGHVHQAAGEMFVQAGEEKLVIAGGTYQVFDGRSKRWHGLPQMGGFTFTLDPMQKKMGLFRTPTQAQEYIHGRIADNGGDDPYTEMIKKLDERKK